MSVTSDLAFILLLTAVVAVLAWCGEDVIDAGKIWRGHVGGCVIGDLILLGKEEVDRECAVRSVTYPSSVRRIVGESGDLPSDLGINIPLAIELLLNWQMLNCRGSL